MTLTGYYTFASLLAIVATTQAQNGSGASGPPPGSNPLTWGFYATHEIQDTATLSIEGHIPNWLTGSLYRGAAATWDVGNFTAEHWFDGFSRNHRFEIANGSVSYRSRNGSDELADFVRETGLYPHGTFGSDPCKIIFGAFETTFRDGSHAHGNKTSANVNVAWAPDFPGLARNGSSTGTPFETLVVTTDANDLQQIDPLTLEPIELFTYQASNLLLNDSGRSAAHPAHVDGTIYNYVLDLSVQPPVYRVFGLSPLTGEANIVANITDAPPAYIHSLFSTQNYLVLIVWQADLTKKGKTLLSSIGPWDPNRKTLFYVIDRLNGGVVSKYVSEESFFAFHEINSFEDRTGSIHIDISLYEDHSVLKALNVPNLRANVGKKVDGPSPNDPQGRFTRYRLPSHSHDARYANGTFIEHRAERVFKLPYGTANIELPRVNQAYAGKPYRYAYGIHLNQPGFFSDSLIKVDLETLQSTIWTPSTMQLPSEPIFVATPGAVEEDDGVLLTVAMDAAVKKSSLVVVNATTMMEIGRARMPIVMGYGFHGVWGSMH